MPACFYTHSIYSYTSYQKLTYQDGFDLPLSKCSHILNQVSERKPLKFANDSLHTYRYSSSKAFLYGFVATFFSIFDVPVFWPILLIYFLVLFFITIKRQIRHMIKHKYLPFDIGKKASLSAYFELWFLVWIPWQAKCDNLEKNVSGSRMEDSYCLLIRQSSAYFL